MHDSHLGAPQNYSSTIKVLLASRGKPDWILRARPPRQSGTKNVLLMVAEGSLQDRQAFVAAQTVHAHFGLDHSADRPALYQAGISPTTDFLAVSADLAGQVLDLTGAHQGATEILGHAQTDAGQHVVHTVAYRAGNVVEAPRKVVERFRPLSSRSALRPWRQPQIDIVSSSKRTFMRACHYVGCLYSDGQV